MDKSVEHEDRNDDRRVEAVDAKPEASSEKKPSRIDRALTVLSNGFVLLIIGSVITSILVLTYQQYTGARQTQLNLMQEAHRDFLQYENSIWEEYYAIFPLLHVRFAGWLRNMSSRSSRGRQPALSARSAKM